nr:MAG TPA: hypothetical protein [Caudoviricetes sp.]
MRSSFILSFNPPIYIITPFSIYYVTSRDKKQEENVTKGVDTYSVKMYNVPINQKEEKRCQTKLRLG